MKSEGTIIPRSPWQTEPSSIAEILQEMTLACLQTISILVDGETNQLATKSQHRANVHEDKLMQSIQSEYDKSLHHNRDPQIKIYNSWHRPAMLKASKHNSRMMWTVSMVTNWCSRASLSWKNSRETSNHVAHQMYTRNHTIGPVLLAVATQGEVLGQLLSETEKQC